jgi:hypothetical protein
MTATLFAICLVSSAETVCRIGSPGTLPDNVPPVIREGARERTCASTYHRSRTDVAILSSRQ